MDVYCTCVCVYKPFNRNPQSGMCSTYSSVWQCVAELSAGGSSGGGGGGGGEGGG